MTLAGVVKEDLACPGSSLPEKKKKKKKQASSDKRQASSFKKIQPVVVWITLRKILTMVQGCYRMSILTNTGEIHE